MTSEYRHASPHRWPAEWERQSATWIAWPHNLETWPDRFDPIPGAFARFIAAIGQAQPVHVLSGPDDGSRSARALLAGIPNATLHSVETNDVWIRDYGPTFVRRRDDGTLVG